MHNDSARAPHPAPTVYALPEHAHVELIQLRDHLRLMAQLTEVGSNASRHHARLRPDALAWWFSRLSRDIDGIVEATYWSDAIAGEAQTRRTPGRRTSQRRAPGESTPKPPSPA